MINTVNNSEKILFPLITILFNAITFSIGFYLKKRQWWVALILGSLLILTVTIDFVKIPIDNMISPSVKVPFGQVLHSNMNELNMNSMLDKQLVFYLSDAWNQKTIVLNIEYENGNISGNFKIRCQDGALKNGCEPIDSVAILLENDKIQIIEDLDSLIPAYRQEYTDLIFLDGYILEIDIMDYKNKDYTYLNIGNASKEIPYAYKIAQKIFLLLNEIKDEKLSKEFKGLGHFGVKIED